MQAAHRRLSTLALALALAATATPLAAQSGAIAGRVTDAQTGAPVAAATVRAILDARTVGQQLTAADGRYTIAGLAAGTYTVEVRRIGYTLRTTSVTVGSGQASGDVALAKAATALDQVIITDTRGSAPQKVLDAPASISVVTARDVAERPALSVADHVKGMPGVDVSSGGLIQSNIVARGFNNAFSGAMLMLQDNRFASVPSLRVNVPALFPTTNEDIDHIELLLGPAAALYGPNSASGVLHVVTKSPFNSQGAILTVDGGTRGVFRGGARWAGVLSPKAAVKLSGEYMRGFDWGYYDPSEPATVNRPSGTGTRVATPNARDFDVRKGGGEARLDLRPTAGMEWITSYGFSNIGSGIEITGANGASQVKNWLYQSLQTRMRYNKTFLQVFGNLSNAGNKDSNDASGTFLLRTGTPIVDKSRVMSAQLQQGFDFGTKQNFIAGFDYIATNPETGHTINGRNEDIDNVTEYGGYLHSVSHLTPMFDFVAAARVDKHSEMDETFFSPRAALVFKPSTNQNFRVTFNRAFSTPANFSFFLDLPQGTLRPTLPYDIRALGVPKTGFQFPHDCTGGAGNLCMRSPFPILAANPTAAPATNPNTRTAANAADFYRTILAGNQTAFVNALLAAGVTPGNVGTVFGNLLGSASPTPAQVATILRLFDPSGVGRPQGPFSRVVTPAEVTDVERLKASFNNTIELGYKGGLADNRVQISISGWREQRENFVTPATNVTPNAFMDATTLGQLIGARLTAEAAAGRVPAAAVAPLVTAFTTQLAQVPVGTVLPDNALTDRPDFIFTYRNVDQKITVSGADFAVDLQPTTMFGITANFSLVDKSAWNILSGVDSLRLNAPKYKGALAFRYRNDASGLGGELRGRYTDAFKVNSGVYVGAVPVNALIDAGITYHLPLDRQNATISLSGTNLIGKRVPTFVGVPAIGRMIMTRLQYEF